jgi:hypothetical protein
MLKGCAGVNTMCPRAEDVLISEHYYFSSKSLTSVSEAFNNAYRDREVQYKTTINRLVTKFRDTNVCNGKRITSGVLTGETLR